MVKNRRESKFLVSHTTDSSQAVHQQAAAPTNVTAHEQGFNLNSTMGLIPLDRLYVVETFHSLPQTFDL